MLKLNTFSYIKIFSRNLLTLYLEIFKQKIRDNNGMELGETNLNYKL